MRQPRKILIPLLLILCGHIRAQQSALVVNEVMVGNIDQWMDPSYNYGGWIEIYNTGTSAASLSNMYISDDESNLRKFRLPSTIGSVAAGKFKTLWFDHYSTGNEYSNESSKQINFKLNPEGGTLYISNSVGKLLITQPYPPMVSRASYARVTDGDDEWRYTSDPTPAATNTTSQFADRQMDAPVVDHDATVYTMPFQLHVSVPEGATLRYTTDGSTPTMDNGQTSADGVFNIDGNNYVYRFRLFKTGWLASPVVTRTYIYKDKEYYLPIVSVVTDPKNLYDPTIGAYVDGTNGIGGNGGNGNQNSNKNRSWERPVNFEYLVPNSNDEYSVALDQMTDFEVSGGWSRHFKPAASFKLKSSKVYEFQNYLDYPIFQSKPYIKNKAIIVRNGGNDCNCRIYDAAIHEILRSSGFYIDCQAWQPAHIFINGQYQFMFNLRETNNKNFGYSNYGIDKDDMDQFEFNGGGYKQMIGDDVAYQKWVSLASQLASSPTNDAIYQQICDLVDIDEFCNYMAAECYVGCNDWLTNNNNVKGFRSRSDGRFHIVFMDLDQGFAYDDILNRLQSNGWGWGWGSTNSMIQIFVDMLKHEGFKRRFIDTYCIVAGSIFDAERSSQIIHEMADYMEPALAMDGKSPWQIVGQSGSNTSVSGTSLLNAITDKNKRQTRMNTLRNYFNLTSTYDVALKANIPQADIMINGVKVQTGHFDGNLYGPATFTTEAPAGYRFLGWATAGGLTNVTTLFDTGATWQYYDQGSLDGQQWRASDYNTAAWRTGSAPFGYGSIVGVSGRTDFKTTISYGNNANSKRPTYYFRNQFDLDADPATNEVFTLNYYVDDGCIIYVNGTEVTRYLMPQGDILYNQYATTYVGSTCYAGTVDIDPALLHAGQNTIAVEVHNNSATSSDIYWTASMTKGVMGVSDYKPTMSLADLSTNSHYDITAYYEAVPDSEIVSDGRSLIITTTDEPYAPIRINEVSAGNSVYVNEYFKKNDWIELYNTTDMELNVAGLYLTDNVNKLQKYQIPADIEGVNTIIPAGGHLVLWADKLEPLERSLAATSSYVNLSDLHTMFKLANTDDETVVLTSSPQFVENNPQYFALHPSFAEGFSDQLNYTTHVGDQSVGRYPDGGNNIYVMNRPTIGTVNATHSYDTFVGRDLGLRHAADDDTGIDNLAFDTASPSGSGLVGIYTTSGMLVGTDSKTLSRGIYLFRFADGTSRKVSVQ